MVCCTKAQMKAIEEYLDEGHGAERLTKVKTIWITASFCFFSWLALEVFHVGLIVQLQVLGEGFHHTPLHRYFWGGRENGGDQCSSHAQSCPMWEPLADCETQTREFIDFRYRSVVMGHTITEWEWLRIPINCIHVGGVCLIAWYSCIMLVSGGTRANCPWKKAVMKHIWITLMTMLCTGFLQFFLRSPHDRGYPSTNLAPSWSDGSEIKPPAVNLFHDLGRWCYFIAFAGGFVNSLGNGLIHNLVPPKLLAIDIGVCLVCEVLAAIVFTVQLCSTDWLWYPWPSQVQDLEMLSMYPFMDCLNAYVLYNAWYKNKEYDWDGHRSFNFCAFYFIAFTVIMYFVTIDYGICFNRPVLLWEKLMMPLPGLVFFTFYALVPQFRRMMKLSSARTAQNLNYESLNDEKA